MIAGIKHNEIHDVENQIIKKGQENESVVWILWLICVEMTHENAIPTIIKAPIINFLFCILCFIAFKI